MAASAITTSPAERIKALLDAPFGSIPHLVLLHAENRPDQAALIQDDRVMTYRELARAMNRIATALQRDGLVKGDSIAICGTTSFDYVALYLGGLLAGVVVAPLSPSSSPEALAKMIVDSGARHLFVDGEVAEMVATYADLPAPLLLDRTDARGVRAWLDARVPEADARPAFVELGPADPFNIIYSSGTTGDPKGIVQTAFMRWAQLQRAKVNHYTADSVALFSTPLYSNTTLATFFGAIGTGGTSVLMAKFDTTKYLELAETHRVTHTILVPVQYKRLMAEPDFDRYDLSAFVMKGSTAAPFPAALKADVLRRWPGGLLEVYGMTEGGGVFILEAHKHPDKLHTVGKPALNHDIRLLDDEGREVAKGEAGEIVGHSPSMMIGYRNQPKKTAEMEWFDTTGKRFLRSGDVGRFDEDGFLVLLDRKKDMIISGGFNIFPSDLEAVLADHPDLHEYTVVGVPSERWGETPVAFVVARAGGSLDAGAVKAWANERLGKMQRLADVRVVERLPRSPIGKVLKRELRATYQP